MKSPGSRVRVHKKAQDQADHTVQALDRIDSNTGKMAASVTVISEDMRKIVDATRGTFNVPASFTVPNYAPTGGARGAVYLEVTNQVTVTDTTAPAVAEEVARATGPSIVLNLQRAGYGR